MSNSFDPQSINSWLFLAAGEDRSFAGNDGYDDMPNGHYKWDSTVPNHARVKVGDYIVLWDKNGSIGASSIDEINIRKSEKTLHRCRHCGKASIKKRITKTPLYRCQICKRTFEEPESKLVDVTEYTTTHSRKWTPLLGVIEASTLRTSCLRSKSQHSLRPLDWSKFSLVLQQKGLFLDLR